MISVTDEDAIANHFTLKDMTSDRSPFVLNENVEREPNEGL